MHTCWFSKNGWMTNLSHANSPSPFFHPQSDPPLSLAALASGLAQCPQLPEICIPGDHAHLWV
jgi:hypothetical protein